MSRGPDDFGSESFRQSVAEFKKLNPTHVTLIITLSQDNAQATKITAGNETPTDVALISAIDYIHSLGLKTHLKFHIETKDHAWRAYINPPDTVRSDAHPKNTERWSALIREVRAIFSGKLTYCANSSTTISDWTNEKARIGFWPELDYIGISAYHGMTASNLTVESFKDKWNILNTNDYSKLHMKYNRPLVLCEVGYRNVAFAHTALYDFWTKGESHETRQADLYQALFSYWDNYDYFSGVHLWHWSSDPTVGGPENTDYMPRGKKAEQIIATWWGGEVSSKIIPPDSVAFTLRGRATPKIVKPNEQVTIYAIVNNQSQARENLIIDIEVYNASGEKVFQKVREKNNSRSDSQKHTKRNGYLRHLARTK